MKTLKFIGLFAFALMFMTACESDTGGGPSTQLGPSVLFLSGDGLISFDSDIEPGENIKIKLDATKGDADLKALTVSEDNIVLSTDRFTIDGSAPSANPKLLFSPDTGGFIWVIEITAPNDNDAHIYSFEVSDDNGKRDEASVEVTRTLDPTPGSLTLNGSGDYIVEPNSVVSISFSATKGGTELNQIAVYEGDDLVAIERLAFGSSDNGFSINPLALEGDDRAGFEKSIYIRSGDAGFSNYSVEVTDVYGNVQKSELSITSGTPLVQSYVGVLLNAAGPAGTGGLDLDTGNGTGSTALEAEIKDRGIDTDLAPDINWLRQIAPVNGSIMKYVKAGEGGVIEGFQYEWAETKEEIIELHNAGVDLAGNYSDVVEEGDIFTVYNGDIYFIIVVRGINATTSDNEDSYTFDIKY